MKKTLCVLLSVIALACSAIPAYAAEIPDPVEMQSEVQPMFVATASVQARLSIGSDGKSSISVGDVVASNVAYKTALTVELQRKSGSAWTTIKSWDMTGANSCTVSKAYYVNYGTYRVCVRSKVYNASGALLEALTQYSQEVTY